MPISEIIQVVHPGILTAVSANRKIPLPMFTSCRTSKCPLLIRYTADEFMPLFCSVWKD